MHEAMVTRERVTARIPAQVRETLEAAAAATGATLNQFMVQASVREAERVLEQEQVIRLNQENMKKFIAVLDNTTPPNQRLQRLLVDYRKNYNAETGIIDWEPRPKDV